MIHFTGRGILLDIEGTTSSISYVYDILFPYARRELAAFLHAHWDENDVVHARELIARDAGAPSFESWCAVCASKTDRQNRVVNEVLRLMDGDVKSTGLKDLQGLIWREGFQSGVLQAHVFADVPTALAAWKAAGMVLCIYSSGSVAAQRLFFSHTEAGDLSGFFSGYYDTNVGPKRSPASYTTIATNMNLAPAEILFLSDVTAELDAAREAGMQTALTLRPGNGSILSQQAHAAVSEFSEISPESA